MTLSQCTLDMTRRKEMFIQCHQTLRSSQMLTDLTPTIVIYKHQTAEKDQVAKAKVIKIQETPMNSQSMKPLQHMKVTRFKRKMKLIHPSLMNPSRHQKSKKVPMHYRLGHSANLWLSRIGRKRFRDNQSTSRSLVSKKTSIAWALVKRSTKWLMR